MTDQALLLEIVQRLSRLETKVDTIREDNLDYRVGRLERWALVLSALLIVSGAFAFHGAADLATLL